LQEGCGWREGYERREGVSGEGRRGRIIH
jgi:hypothetical protein